MHEERPSLKVQAAVSIMLCFSVEVLYGAGSLHHASPVSRARDCSSDRIQHIQMPEKPAVVAVTSQPEMIICPNSDDVRQSIGACQKLASEARSVVRDNRQGFPFAAEKSGEQIVAWKSHRSVWQNKNDLLIAGCDLLLSAHGREVNPEIPRALKNLNNAQLWLGWAVDASGKGNFDTSDALIRYADRAIKRADRLNSLDYSPYSRACVVRLPRSLERQLAAFSKAADREQKKRDPAIDPLAIPQNKT